MTASPPTVAVWKSSWLAPSQTFVQNQVASLRRWHPLLLGLRRLSDGLPVVPDRAPFPSNRAGQVAERLSAATGYRGVYDALLRRPDVRLVHAHFGTSAASVLPLVRRHRLPLVVTFHGFDVTREPLREDRTGRRYRRALPEVFDQASVLLVNSEFLAGRLLALGAPEDKVRVHRIGIPTDGAAAGGAGGAGEEARTAPEGPRDGIVFVGRLVDVKGPGDLVEAAARLAAAGHRVRVRLIGSGPLAVELRRRAAELGVDAELLGHRSPAEVAEVLDRSAVFCGPSRTAPDGAAEAFGMVFLEAALHGLPVVAYRHGGVPEATVDGETSLLVPEGDVDGLARALGRLLDDEALRLRLGAAGRDRVLRELDVRTCTAQLEEIYDEVADRHPRP